MKKARLLPCLAWIVAASSLAACSSNDSNDDVAHTSDALTSTAFASDLAKVEQRLAALRIAEAAEKRAALALSIEVQRRDRAFESYALGRGFLAGQLAHEDSAGAKATIEGLRASKKKLAIQRPLIRSLQLAHKTKRAELEALLALQRTEALGESELTGQSGAFALQVLAADYSFGLSRRLPSLHTQVVSLRDKPQCRGDLILEGNFGSYLRAAASEDEAAALIALGRIQTQLSCVSALQLRALEQAMVAEIDTTLARTLGKRGPLVATRFRQMIAIPLILLADQNRALRSHGKPGLAWILKNKGELVRAAATPGTILHRLGLTVYDPRLHRLVPVGSKAQRAGKLTKYALDTKNLVFRDGKGGVTTNRLPSFIDGITEPCLAVDLVPEGTATDKIADGFACDPGCGKAKAERATMGAPGIVPRAPSSTAAAACPGETGGTGGTGGTGDTGGTAGSGGITVGGGSATRCMMDAVTGSSAGAALEACAASLHPAAGELGSAGTAPSGGSSCRPGVSDEGDGTEEYGQSQGTYQPDGSSTTWDVYEDADGNTTFVNQADPNEVVVVTADEQADSEGAIEDALRNSPSGAAEEEAKATETDPPPAPKDSTSGSGGGGTGGTSTTPTPWGSTLAHAVYGAATYTQMTESLEDLELMTYQDDDGEGMCSINPMCQSPNAPNDCASDDDSCSGGCTGRDEAVTAFNECVTSATGGASTSTPASGLRVDDTLINPAPDSGAFSTLPASALLACQGGGTPVDSTCAGQSVKLCTESTPNCNCARTAVLAPPPLGGRCEQMNCTSNSAQGEAVEGAPSGIGACGCQSIMGGQ